MSGPRIHNPDALLPQWMQDLKVLLHSANLKIKLNPGQTLIFNGKFWVPVEGLLKQVETMALVMNLQNDAIGSVNNLFLINPQLANTHAAKTLRKARDSYEKGQIVSDD